ncbi:MAG: outer membrane protein MIP [Lysobacterales bacterium]|jgi:FKBP-type peptidyl-prolyl cis-trans isomerase FklB|nr:MAG: outer membrane protein MIP [Xanthomonadales bacterium]
MKTLVPLLSLLVLAVAPAAAQQRIQGERAELSYAIGYELGRDLAERQLDVDVGVLVRAIQDGHGKREPAVSEAVMRERIGKMQEKLREEAREKFRQIAEENKKKSEQFLAENRRKKGIVALPSGVQYRVIEEGDGPRPALTSQVTVHYRGSLISGLEFDSSFARGVPATFQVDQVLPGWQEVLPLMRVGDYWQVFLPPELAYGERGNPPIGPNEALIFDIRLLEVK